MSLFISNRVKHILFTLFLSLIFIPGFCQKSKIKFGKVSKEEMQMTHYSQDSSASAVILSDIGRFTDADLKFNRHIRVKILKKSGLDWGNWVFNTPFKSSFKVLVFNMKNGEIEQTKANRDNIYEEQIVDDFSIYKVFAPEVKVGSVIDIRYSHVGLPSEWRFQERIPVKYSELEIEESDFVSYSKTLVGFESIQTLSEEKWVAEHMPAFQTEPYLSTYKNYITKFQFQLSSFGGGRFFYAISTSWSNIINNLYDSPRFGSILKGSAFLNSYAKELKAQNISVEEKVEKAYAYIQEHMKWNGVKSLYADADARFDFKKSQSGNSASVNLLLITLLNKMDIRTFPVALSTKDNGIIQKNIPSINGLNYVIAYVKQGETEMLIDATNENAIPGILPMYCLNYHGLLVEKETELWIGLNGKHKDKSQQFTTISIDEDGLAKGIINVSHNDYNYLKWVEDRKLADKTDDIFLDQIKEKYNTLEILNYELLNDDKSKLRATEKYEIDLTDQIVDTGESIIISPNIMNEFTSNPLKPSERRYPLDFECQQEYQSTVLIKLPENYTPLVVPESMKFNTRDKSASCMILANSNASAIQLKITVKIDREVYAEGEYPELRAFFAEIAKQVNQPIELKQL